MDVLLAELTAIAGAEHVLTDPDLVGEIAALRAVKSAADPAGHLNPAYSSHPEARDVTRCSRDRRASGDDRQPHGRDGTHRDRMRG